MEGRGKKKREENEDLIISQLLLSSAGKYSSVQGVTLSFTVSHFPASNDVTEDTDTGFSGNLPPARWPLALRDHFTAAFLPSVSTRLNFTAKEIQLSHTRLECCSTGDWSGSPDHF